MSNEGLDRVTRVWASDVPHVDSVTTGYDFAIGGETAAQKVTVGNPEFGENGSRINAPNRGNSSSPRNEISPIRGESGMVTIVSVSNLMTVDVPMLYGVVTGCGYQELRVWRGEANGVDVAL